MDRFEPIKQQAEREMLEKEIQWLGGGSINAPVEYYFKGERWLRMPRWAAETHLRAEYLAGVRHRLRTKDAILAFLTKHSIPHEVIDHEAERNTRAETEAHKRMRAAALNRRRQMVKRPLAGRAFP